MSPPLASTPVCKANAQIHSSSTLGLDSTRIPWVFSL
eukprot:COSAG06_NODE_65434_length_257_cov_0.613924_1_plen_36_part_10